MEFLQSMQTVSDKSFEILSDSSVVIMVAADIFETSLKINI